MKIIMIVFLTLSSSVYAQVPVRKGDVVTVDGVLLTNAEAAKILAENSSKDELCEINTAHEKEKLSAVCALEKKNLEITISSQREQHVALDKIKDAEIGRLYKHIEKYDESSGNGAYWFSGGLVVGGIVAVITSVAIFFAATQISKTAPLIQ